MATQKTYRDQTTGIVREYPPSLAAVFPNLIEVEPGTKPLVEALIPQRIINQYSASTSEPEDTDTSDEEEED